MRTFLGRRLGRPSSMGSPPTKNRRRPPMGDVVSTTRHVATSTVDRLGSVGSPVHP